MHWGRIVAPVAVALLLAGCAAGTEPPGDGGSSSTATEPIASQTPTVAVLAPLESIAAVGGTKWRAKDSDGDVHNISFQPDGTLVISTAGIQAESSWSVEGDALLFTLPFGPPAGIATMTGTLDVATQVITASGSDELGQLTLEMTQIPPE